MDIIDDIATDSDTFLLKFDNKKSKYDDYINTINYRVVNITDPEIIDFYDITIIPTICIYKNKNLIETIEGYLTKSELLKKINYTL